MKNGVRYFLKNIKRTEEKEDDVVRQENKLMFFNTSAFSENPIDIYAKQSSNLRDDLIIFDFKSIESYDEDDLNLQGNLIVKKLHLILIIFTVLII